MSIAALGFAVFAVLVGTLILADVSGPTAASPPRPILTAHVVLALVSLAALGVGAAVANVAAAAVGAATVLATGAFGITALRRTLARSSAEDLSRPSNAVLVVHGAAAAATLICALIAVISS